MKFIALILISMPCLANGPLYVGSKTDPQVLQEFQNVYHDISNPTINTGTASTMTVTNLIVSTSSVGSHVATVSQLSCFGAPVQALYTGTSSTSNSAYTATGFTVSITPTSASHRVLLMVNHLFQVAGGNQGGATIYANGSDILGGTSWGYSRLVPASTLEAPVSFTYIDSPATTSQVTYEIRIKAVSGGTVQAGDATISMIAWECL